jgi:acyl-CoA thioesterase-1
MLLAGMVLCIWLLTGCDRKEPIEVETEPEQPVFMGTILAIGNSLTEGYGLGEADAYPALLQQRLLADGHRYKVINAGISGETTSGLRSRIDWAITLAPDIVIIETGANDALRGIDPALIKGNIEAVILSLKKRNIPIVLAGMRIYKNLGPGYANTFESIYPDLAKTHNLIYMPFFLKDVAGNPGLNLQDGMHPTTEGYRIISNNITPYVVEAITQLEKK